MATQTFEGPVRNAEETYDPNLIFQHQVCIIMRYDDPPMDLYETIVHRGYIEQGSLIKKGYIGHSYSKTIFYVRDPALALELAQRWANEEPQRLKNYRVIGVDNSFSVFD